MNTAQCHRSLLTARSRLILGTVMVVLATLTWWGWVPASFTQPSCRLASNAAWIGVEWTSEPVDAHAVAKLASQTRTEHLQFLYPFTTYLKSDGSWSTSYTYAKPFVTTFHQHNQQTAVLAWVGLPYQHIDFTNTQARTQIIAFLTRLITDGDFDGLHLNAEPIPNGDGAYLQFLQELRAALDPHSLLSVASLPWASMTEAAITPNNPYRWSSTYYRAIAERFDQVVVMTYDSHTPAPALYRLWMREQVAGIRQSIVGMPVHLLIGISVSREATTSHRPSVESLPQGLAGLCAAVTWYGVDTVEGVALYAFWEAETTDWQVWQEWQQGATKEE